MRILDLHLIAFGPFTDLRLDLSAAQPALHVVYGANEAGKSTALRAIRGLLYGIPHLSPDDHLHRGPDLRIGGRLESAAGRRIQVVRRKGRVKTLFDERGEAADDELLRPFLGGVGEDLFRTMFGLDHGTLRQGGEALLEGKGDVGESLFGAGLGAGLHQVLAELRKEASDLFTPQAKVRPLNEAIKALSEAQRRARDAATLPAAWEAQKQAIAETEAARGRVEEEAAGLRATERRLRRALRVLPLLEGRRTAMGERAAMGDVALLGDEAPRDREEAVGRAAEAAGAGERLRREIEELEERRAGLSIPESLVELAPEVIDDLGERLGSHRKATVDLPRVRGELRALEDEARGALRRLGRPASIEGIEGLRVDVATEARLKRLAQERGEVEARPREVERLLADRAGKREARVRRMAELPPRGDAAPLRRAAARAQKEGDLEQRLRDAVAEARRLEGAAGAQRDRLGRWARAEGEAIPGAVEAAMLQVPLRETVEQAEARWAALSRQEERAAERGRAALGRLAEIARELSALQGAGAVPTEAELVEARARRDATWKVLHRALTRKGAPKEAAGAAGAGLFDAAMRTERGRGGAAGSGGAAGGGAAGKGGAGGGAAGAGGAGEKAFALTPVEDGGRAQPEVFAELVQKADGIADRLRREAERVARQARLLADRKAAEAEQAAAAADRAGVARLREEEAEAWRALWAKAGVAPLSPAEMRGWISRHADLCAGVERLRGAEAQAEGLRGQIRAHEAELRAALESAGAAPAGADLPGLLEAAERAAQEIEGAARERRELGREVEGLEREIVELERERAEHEGARAAWRAAWAEGVARLGLGAGASTDEATAILDALAELFRTVDGAAHQRRRVQGMERDAEAFEGAVGALVGAHAPDLAGLPVDQAADGLVKRYHKARLDLRAREEIEQRLEDKRRALDEADARRSDAEGRLARLREAARAADLAALEEAEQRSRAARALDRRIRELEGKLLEAGEGSSAAALEQETAGMERDALAVEIERTGERIRELEEERRRLDRELGGLEVGRKKMREPTADAAEAAGEAEGCMEHLRAQVGRYVRARLAAVILEREIERYRERNQGPILARAGALFRQLTLEGYAGLKVSYDESDQAVLRCVRAPGARGQMGLPGEAAPPLREVDVQGLSDGTRDQLYLALRLASLEHHARGGEPMPLVLDDILIHFDDERARAALRALGEMAASAQVLFFTHHARLLDLAREAVPGGVLREHRLG